ncbi:hypothetical protein DIT71_14160 [Marinobacter vulgaris]|uniref:Uncharacterized protein n=1 Tax=Marinobacter vulgaris TaxID=1928331 RepID=A0A2V3ZGT2_9GAMM|nr:hypothetical protein DIT71_14160 [Marinobacter vulgaris]
MRCLFVFANMDGYDSGPKNGLQQDATKPMSKINAKIAGTPGPVAGPVLIRTLPVIGYTIHFSRHGIKGGTK